MLTPAMVHYGQAEEIIQKRQSVLDAAYLAHPERFVHSSPKPFSLPKQVWINKPIESHESKFNAPSKQGHAESRPAGSSSFIDDPGAIFFQEVSTQTQKTKERGEFDESSISTKPVDIR